MVVVRTLKNGLRVAMEKTDYVQSATIGIWVKAGSINEDDTNHGISHFIEHMMFKGTEKRSAKDIASDIDRIGAQINAFTSKENTCYYVRTLTSNLDKACEILVDMITGSQFDPVEMGKEKNVVYEEMKMVEDTPEDDVQDMMAEALFSGNALSNSILGTRESLEAITRDQILDYIKNKYTLDNIVVAASGNFDEEALCAMFEEGLSPLTASREEILLPEEAYKPVFKAKVKDIEQTHICLGTRALKMGDEGRYSLSILNNMLGGSMSSRLFQNIREEKGLAYSVYSFTASYEKTGCFSIAAGVAHDKAEETVEAIIEELDALETEGFDEDELIKSKEQMKGSIIFAQESTSAKMVSIGKNTLILNHNDTPDEILEMIDRVDMESLHRSAELIKDISTYSGTIISRRELDLRAMTARG